MPTYKDEKTGLWYCKFVYTDWMGQKKQKKKMGFRLQKEAKQFELDFLSKNAQSCDIRFCDLVEIYMDDCKARLKPTTYKGKQDVLEKHIIPYFKNFKVNEIQAMTVRRWQTELINDPKKYKPTYLRTLNSQLSAIFNFAVKYYGLPYNPVQRSGPMGKKKSDLMQFWKPDEFQLFIEAVSDKVMSKVIFNLLYWTGMRSGELLALTLNDFDFEERTVSINKNFARVDGEDLFLEPKTPKSRRKITLPQFVCDMVKDYADKLYGYALIVRSCSMQYLTYSISYVSPSITIVGDVAGADFSARPNIPPNSFAMAIPPIKKTAQNYPVVITGSFAL